MTQFDTLDFAKKLADAGVPVQQAEAHSQLLSDVLGKSTVSPSQQEVLEKAILARIEALDLKTENRFASLENKLSMLNSKVDEHFSMLNSKMDEQFSALNHKIDTMKWVIGLFVIMMAGTTSLVSAILFKLLP